MVKCHTEVKIKLFIIIKQNLKITNNNVLYKWIYNNNSCRVKISPKRAPENND